jgi:xylulokinase
MKTILTVDVGTTAVKISLFSGKLELIGFSCIEYSLSASDGKIVELAADVYWDACCRSIRKVTSDELARGDDVCAVAVTTQGETLVPVDVDGMPLMNAIVWLDARAEDESATINSQVDPELFYHTTGIPHIGPACPASKLLWIKNKEPVVFARTFKFLLCAIFLVNGDTISVDNRM